MSGQALTASCTREALQSAMIFPQALRAASSSIRERAMTAPTGEFCPAAASCASVAPLPHRARASSISLYPAAEAWSFSASGSMVATDSGPP